MNSNGPIAHQPWRVTSSANCSTSGSWDDWHTRSISDGENGAWIKTDYSACNLPFCEERYRVRLDGRQDENDQFDWWLFAEPNFGTAQGHGSVRSKVVNTWFTTNSGYVER